MTSLPQLPHHLPGFDLDTGGSHTSVGTGGSVRSVSDEVTVPVNGTMFTENDLFVVVSSDCLARVERVRLHNTSTLRSPP